jgi:hypothetical protein
MVIRWITPGLCVGLLVVAGCSTDDSPTSPQGTGRTVKADPSFANDIQEIFNRNGCTAATCHGSATPPRGLDLRAANAYDSLVNKPATEDPSLFRVHPGQVDSSYLVVKLLGPGNGTLRMPAGGTPLDSIDMQNIRNWITQGAKDN